MMVVLEFLFTTLLGVILITSLLVATTIALYMLKILLSELFDGKGVNDFVLWLKKKYGTIAAKKKKNL